MVRRRIYVLAGGALFVLLATMNSASYRYGASDQAFYIPEILRHLDPTLFPRDRPLIDAQGHLTLAGWGIALIARTTGASLQHLFLALYILTLLLLFAALVWIGRRFYRGAWTPWALVAALTLRHSIAKTGTNTLEAYFHPRQLAFALGLLAVACFLDQLDWAWPLLLIASATLHPTTTAWFVVWLGVAAWVGRPRWRGVLTIVGAFAAVIAVIALWKGPLASHLVRMDADWLAVIASKDYLFPFEWPLSAWFVNLITIPVIVFGWRARRRRALTVPGETALVVGALALVAVFVASLPFNAARVALVVQLQISRIFWFLDVLATIYVVWWLAEGPSRDARGAADRRGASDRPGASDRRGAVIAAVLVTLSLTRGLYSSFVAFPNRALFAVDIADPDWRAAMTWAQSTDPGSGWLADPLHAARYGSSLRAAGRRDVLIEQVKDEAIAMYDRNIAMRVADREHALSTLAWDTPEGARALARRYDLDYLIVDHPVDLPLAHRSGSLFIYKLR